MAQPSHRVAPYTTLRDEVFRAARAYHATLAAYCRAARGGADLEGCAQQVVGASLEYRAALERLLRQNPGDPDCCRREASLRRLLHSVSAKYNLSKRLEQFRVDLTH